MKKLVKRYDAGIKNDIIGFVVLDAIKNTKFFFQDFQFLECIWNAQYYIHIFRFYFASYDSRSLVIVNKIRVILKIKSRVGHICQQIQ